MIQILAGVLLALLGVVLLVTLVRSRDGSILRRVDDFVVVAVFGLILIGGLFAATGLTTGPAPAEASVP